MQIKDLELSRELSAEEQGAVEGGKNITKLDDMFLQNANTTTQAANLESKNVFAVLNDTTVNNAGGNFAVSIDFEDNDTIDQHSDVDQRNRKG